MQNKIKINNQKNIIHLFSNKNLFLSPFNEEKN